MTVTAVEFDELVGLLREFIRQEVMPAEAGIDETDEIPARLIAQAKEMGLYGYALPAEYGGLGLSVEQQVRLAIELGYTSPAFRSLFGTNNGIAGQVLVSAGTDQQRKQWLPRLASHEVVASFALTEPDAGSDPSRLTTSATPEEGGWVIDGLKRYITNAPAADVFMVFARTDPQAPPGKGIGAFVVPAHAERGGGRGPRPQDGPGGCLDRLSSPTERRASWSSVNLTSPCRPGPNTSSLISTFSPAAPTSIQERRCAPFSACWAARSVTRNGCPHCSCLAREAGNRPVGDPVSLVLRAALGVLP